MALASDKRMMVLSSWARHAIWIALVAPALVAADDECLLLLVLAGIALVCIALHFVLWFDPLVCILFFGWWLTNVLL